MVSMPRLLKFVFQSSTMQNRNETFSFLTSRQREVEDLAANITGYPYGNLSDDIMAAYENDADPNVSLEDIEFKYDPIDPLLTALLKLSHNGLLTLPFPQFQHIVLQLFTGLIGEITDPAVLENIVIDMTFLRRITKALVVMRILGVPYNHSHYMYFAWFILDYMRAVLIEWQNQNTMCGDLCDNDCDHKFIRFYVRLLFGTQACFSRPEIKKLRVYSKQEYYTPVFLLDSLKKTMGDFTLDVSSNAYSNSYVQAVVYYNSELSGLDNEWFGNVLCNPPYRIQGEDGSESGNIISLWIEKADVELKRSKIVKDSGVWNLALIIPNNPSAKWYPMVITLLKTYGGCQFIAGRQYDKLKDRGFYDYPTAKMYNMEILFFGQRIDRAKLNLRKFCIQEIQY